MWIPKFGILILSFIGYCDTIWHITPIILKQMKSPVTAQQAIYNPVAVIFLLLIFSIVAGMGLRWGKGA